MLFCLVPAYFYLCVRNCICAIILEILAASHCLSKENNRCVSAKRTGRLVSLWPSFGAGPSERLQFLGRPASLGSGCESEWSSSVHTKRGLMWFLSCQLEGWPSFVKQTQSLLPLSCQQCLQAEISDTPSSFSSWLLRLIGSITHLNDTLSESLTPWFCVWETHAHLSSALKNTVIISFLWFVATIPSHI